MAGISITVPQIYLAEESGELVLREGVNPNQGVHAATRILIIGGGVTGLTVSKPSSALVRLATHANIDAIERMVIAGCWLLSDCRLRSVGITRGPNHLSDRGCSVRNLLHKAMSLHIDLYFSRWEWPPAVCGRHTDLISLRLSKKWCMTSYRILEDLMQALPADGPSGHGVRMRVANFFFDKPIESNPEEYEKMCEIEEAKVSSISAAGYH